MTTIERKVNLFHLPRELRDVIYDHAFGPGSHACSYAAFTVIIGQHSASSGTDAINGLPQWLLTTKVICKEAVELLLRTRWFSPRFPLPSARPRTASISSHSRVATCSPARQSLLFHDQSIRKLSLNFANGCGFVRSASFFNDTTPLHRSQPWTEFLAAMHPFVVHARLHLHLTIDANSLMSSVPFIEWPKEWTSWIEWMDVTLLAGEEESEELKWNAGVYVGRIVGCHDGRWMGPLWRPEGVLEESPCDDPVLSLRDTPRYVRVRAQHHERRRERLRYCLRAGSEHAHPVEHIQSHSWPRCRLFGGV